MPDSPRNGFAETLCPWSEGDTLSGRDTDLFSREAVMQAENAAARRRFTLLDAIIVVAAIAVGIAAVAEFWREVCPVVQKLEFTRVIEPKYIREDLFSRQMRSYAVARWCARRNRQCAPNATRPCGVRWHNGRTGAGGDGLARHDHGLPDPQTFARTVVEPLGPHPRAAWCDRVRARSGCLLAVLSVLARRVVLLHLLAAPSAPTAVGCDLPPARLVGVLWDRLWRVMLGYAEGLVIENPVPSVIVPATVAVAWLVLAVSRKWQAERSWIDRAGRVLGILWLATIPIYLIGFVWS